MTSCFAYFQRTLIGTSRYRYEGWETEATDGAEKQDSPDIPDITEFTSEASFQGGDRGNCLCDGIRLGMFRELKTETAIER
jgi:hypothetical protein